MNTIEYDEKQLPYLTELMTVMNDEKVRKAMAIKVLRPYWMVCNTGFSYKVDAKIHSSCTASSSIECVFGRLTSKSTIRQELSETSCEYMYEPNGIRNRMYRNGIEILGAKPNATNRTYSSSCRITIKELKEACKMNGIKTTKLDKKGLLKALMAI